MYTKGLVSELLHFDLIANIMNDFYCVTKKIMFNFRISNN